MKIIAVDNFARENVADQLIAENVPKGYAYVMAEMLNVRFGGEDATKFFKPVSDDHKLWRGMEELV
ncbi:hypothetical protein VPHK460_0294 [Vibrio phage K460]